MAGPAPLGDEPPSSLETPMANRPPIGCRQRLAPEPRSGDFALPVPIEKYCQEFWKI